MKKCLNCGINAGGQRQQCPICQNSLTGEATENYWPVQKKLKLQSFFYKLQLFIVLTLTVVSLSLDFLMNINTGRHWSIPVFLWAISLEMLLKHFIRKSVPPAAIVTDSVLHVCALLLLTSWYMGFFRPVAEYVVPIFITALLIANLVFTLTDKKGNAMVYLLVSIIIGIAAYAFLFVKKADIPLSYTICLMVSVITFIGICVFRGRAVRNEVEKRMNI